MPSWRRRRFAKDLKMKKVAFQNFSVFVENRYWKHEGAAWEGEHAERYYTMSYREGAI